MASHPAATAPAPDAAEEQPDMKVDPRRAAQLAANLAAVATAIRAANPSGRPVRLVAVSKLKPAADILALATASASAGPGATETAPPPPPPQLHFGENYVQELQRKAAVLPRRLRWHFLGGLQTNKCRALAAGVPNLWAVESVDAAKKADALEQGRAAALADQQRRSAADGAKDAAAAAKDATEGAEDEALVGEPLRVFVQVNTSGEASKSGVAPGADVVALCRHVRERCPHLRLQGLMTIGALARSEAAKDGEENEDFAALRRERAGVAAALGLEDEAALELSMGMSADYEAAIRQGSDEVRVGSTIFGERPPKAEAVI